MIDEEKPDPDELLKAIKTEENKYRLGKLKIFFGMSAGVGKTYSMLEDAQQRLKEGVNVVIGVVNTHGRKETEALMEGLPIIPEKWVKYKDSIFQELDIDKILEVKPELVLVDELAHANVPGSKHPKRWQDVIEILDAGINVYTALNVQHIESRKEMVESITGIQIRETVPDLILERAATIEIVDIPPSELLQRLKEGKVYLGEQSQIAAQNFFKMDHLTALREIALRFTAEKVDHDLHGILSEGKGWKTRERLMVAINPHTSSEQLVRAARKLAFELDTPWVAVYVDTDQPLSDEDQKRLNKHLNLARDLGAEVITTHDLDVAEGLQRIANQKNVTRIVIGRSNQQRSIKDFFRKSLFDRLEQENKNIDILILRQDRLVGLYQKALPLLPLSGSFFEYGLVLMTGALSILGGFLLLPFIGYKAVGFVFLLGILILSLFVSQVPIISAALLSALAWDYFFIPPSFYFFISDSEDIALILIYLCTAAIMGIFSSRFRNQDRVLKLREQKIEGLYEVVKEIADTPNFQYLRLNVASRLKKLFKGEFEILIKNIDNQLIFDSPLPFLQQEIEQSAAIWSFQHGKIAGWSTNTLPSAQAMYIPITYASASLGVLVYYPKDNRPLSMDEINFFHTVAEQLGIYLERYIFEESVINQNISQQVEKIHGSIFHSLSRGVFAPLEKILELNQQLQQLDLNPKTQQLLKEMENSSKGLKMILENVIDISQLESGFVHFEKKKNLISDIIKASLQATKPLINSRVIKIDLPDHDLYVDCDFHLLELALNNLLMNAIEYSPHDQPVMIKFQRLENEIRISVLDRGPGIPKEILPSVFQKFYRIPGTETTGTGLGLAIVKSIVDIHQGRIEVKNREGGGTDFAIFLPV